MAAKKAKRSPQRSARKSVRSDAEQGERRARSDAALQKRQEAQRSRRKRQEPEQKPLQPRGRKYPEPELPAQHLEKPGLESELEPRPHYRAPAYRGSGKLRGKVALITGGDSGIGRAVAVLFAREGADVAIAYLSEHSDAEETRAAVAAEGQRAILLPGDVSKSRACDKAVKRTVKELGKLDILVNNAAYQQHQESLLDITDEQLARTFHTNIFGYFYMARAALPHLQRGAVILNTGSVTGMDGSPKLLDYASTKGAIHAFTKSLAQNLVKHGIRVNGVAPGPVWTPLNPADQDAEQVAKFGADVNVQRPAQPEEIAPAFVFLAADSDASYITGEIISIFGGEPTN
jgi:NAD(P)-dependent dehydrogenase (short-subunit alcohol dehydrogenase family)